MEGQQARIVGSRELRSIIESSGKLEYLGRVEHSTGYDYTDSRMSDVFPSGLKGQYADNKLKMESEQEAQQSVISQATAMGGLFLVPTTYSNQSAGIGWRDCRIEAKVYRLRAA